MVVCIPSVTEVEMRAVKESCERVNGKEVYLIEPMAAAIGIGIDIMQPKSDCGYRWRTTEIAVIALGELYVTNQ
jgi:rod shape-determining protein MreB